MFEFRKPLYSLFQEHKYFFYPYFVFLFAGAIRLVFVSKGFEVLWLNSIHNSFLDNWLLAWTFVGDGLFFVLFLLPILIFSWRKALIGFASFAFSGIFVQIFKHFVNAPRPKAYFMATHALYFVPGVNVHSSYSFPSGHSATGFAFFLFLYFITTNKKMGAVYLLGAMFVGASRIYLCQHFFIDVYFGSIIGVVCSSLVKIFIENSNNNRIAKIPDTGLGSMISRLLSSSSQSNIK